MIRIWQHPFSLNAKSVLVSEASMNQGTLLGRFGHYRQRAQQMGLRGVARSVIARTMRGSRQLVQRTFLFYRLDRLLKSFVAARYEQVTANNLRTQTLGFVEAMRVPGEPIGRYRYSESQRTPVLYASVYAALVRHLYGDLDSLTADEKSQWVTYINSFQSADGLFRDPAVANEIAETEDWWGWRHLSAHVVTALTCLGGRPCHPFAFLETLYRPGAAHRWISRLSWREKPDSVSNTVMNYGVLLQYERDFNDNSSAAKALEEVFAFLDEAQDPSTGLWGNAPFRTPRELSIAVQTAYHLWNLYFYDQRPIRFIERAVDHCLATQNGLGGYGAVPNTSACEDIDTVDPLCRFYFLVDYRRPDIRASLHKALRWVSVNQMTDGGFVFQRFAGFAYGHERMTTGPEQSNLFATWFRTLSVAYISQVLDLPGLSAGTWRWVRCPGYQFWHHDFRALGR